MWIKSHYICGFSIGHQRAQIIFSDYEPITFGALSDSKFGGLWETPKRFYLNYNDIFLNFVALETLTRSEQSINPQGVPAMLKYYW